MHFDPWCSQSRQRTLGPRDCTVQIAGGVSMLGRFHFNGSHLYRWHPSALSQVISSTAQWNVPLEKKKQGMSLWINMVLIRSHDSGTYISVSVKPSDHRSLSLSKCNALCHKDVTPLSHVYIKRRSKVKVTSHIWHYFSKIKERPISYMGLCRSNSDTYLTYNIETDATSHSILLLCNSN